MVWTKITASPTDTQDLHRIPGLTYFCSHLVPLELHLDPAFGLNNGSEHKSFQVLLIDSESYSVMYSFEPSGLEKFMDPAVMQSFSSSKIDAFF